MAPSKETWMMHYVVDCGWQLPMYMPEINTFSGSPLLPCPPVISLLLRSSLRHSLLLPPPSFACRDFNLAHGDLNMSRRTWKRVLWWSGNGPQIDSAVRLAHRRRLILGLKDRWRQSGWRRQGGMWRMWSWSEKWGEGTNKFWERDVKRRNETGERI